MLYTGSFGGFTPKPRGVKLFVNTPTSQTLWTPTQITTKVWLDASDSATITASSGAVSSWTDKSGNGYTFTQGTAGANPTTGATTQNSLNVINFDGGDWLSSTATNPTWLFLHDGTKHSIFFVAKFGSTSNPGVGYVLLGTQDLASDSRGALVFYDDRVAASLNDALRHFITNASSLVVDHKPQNVITPNAFGLASIRSDAGNVTADNRSTISVNGGANNNTNAVTGTPTSTHFSTPLRIGAATDGSFPLVGSIAEIVIVQSDMSASDFDKVEGYLAWKWGLVGILNAGHPYKSTPPYI